MQIRLTKEHEDWLRAQVAAGRFASLDDAIAEAVAGLRGDDDELAWARPLVAEGLAELDAGKAIRPRRFSPALRLVCASFIGHGSAPFLAGGVGRSRQNH